MNTHRHVCRVYYEDTDLQGIVYYANYFRFIERGRTEALTRLGIDQIALLGEHGVMFVVRRVEADYISPARFGDDLDVMTLIGKIGAASLDMAQEIRRGDTLLFRARVSIAVINEAGRPSRMPQDLRQSLASGV